MELQLEIKGIGETEEKVKELIAEVQTAKSLADELTAELQNLTICMKGSIPDSAVQSREDRNFFRQERKLENDSEGIRYCSNEN